MKFELKKDKIKNFPFLLNKIKGKHREYNIPANCFFLGAGCSKSSGIPLGSEVMEICRKLSFIETCHDCIDKNGNEKFDTYIKSVEDFVGKKTDDYDKYKAEKENDFREYLNKEDILPKIPEYLKNSIGNSKRLKGSDLDNFLYEEFKDDFFYDGLYGNWFEEYNQDKKERQVLLEDIIEEKTPDGAYITFANFIKQGIIRNVFTTNFDDLLNEALLKYMNCKARVYSHNEMADFISITSTKPNIIKLHGDYLFENIQNSIEETLTLNPNMQVKLKEALNKLGLIVIGYHGSDHSIMSILEEIKLKDRRDFLLIWCGKDAKALHWRVINLINATRNSFFVKIEDFESLVSRLYAHFKTPKPNLINVAEETSKKLDMYLAKFGSSVQEKEDIPDIEKNEINRLTEADRYFYQAYDEADQAKKIELYSKSIEYNPNNSSAYNNRGIEYYNQRKYDKALIDYNKAIELDPNNSLAYNNRGNIYYYQEKYDKALSDYNKAIEFNPNNSLAYNNRGLIYYNQKKYDRALTDYNKAIELDPNSSFAYNSRGNAYYNKQEYGKALVDYNKAIEFDPNNSFAYSNRGNIYYNQQEYDKALIDYDKAIELDPNNPFAYNSRGNVYSNKKEYSKALNDYNKAIELDPNNSSVYNDRGNVYSNQKEYDKALNDYNKAIEFDPNNSSAYNDRGNVYSNQKEYDKALNDYNKAINLDKNFSWAYNNRGVIFIKQKKYSNAQKDLEKAVYLEPINVLFHLVLSELYLLMGNFERSLETLSRIRDNLTITNEKLIFYFLNSILLKLSDRDVSQSDKEFHHLLKEITDLEWSFDEIEQFLNDNSSLEKEKRNYIEEKINLLKGKLK